MVNLLYPSCYSVINVVPAYVSPLFFTELCIIYIVSAINTHTPPSTLRHQHLIIILLVVTGEILFPSLYHRTSFWDLKHPFPIQITHPSRFQLFRYMKMVRVGHSQPMKIVLFGHLDAKGMLWGTYNKFPAMNIHAPSTRPNTRVSSTVNRSHLGHSINNVHTSAVNTVSPFTLFLWGRGVGMKFAFRISTSRGGFCFGNQCISERPH